jgi:hypothetical protein
VLALHWLVRLSPVDPISHSAYREGGWSSTVAAPAVSASTPRKNKEGVKAPFPLYPFSSPLPMMEHGVAMCGDSFAPVLSNTRCFLLSLPPKQTLAVGKRTVEKDDGEGTMEKDNSERVTLSLTAAWSMLRAGME